jgi:hypothetical protein
MAKMQGFGGKADATLVGAATRAAFANVPKDLSGIFNNIAQSYAVGMSQLGAGISQAVQAAGTAAGTAIAEAKKQNELIEAGGKYFEGQTETLQKQLEDIKEERSAIRGETKFLSKDRREQMRANRRKEDKIYASLAQIDNVMQEAKSSFIEGGLDHIMMGEDSNNFFSTFFAGGGEVKNAKGEVIGRTKIDFDEEGNEVISFLDADDKVKLNKYGKPMQGDIEFVKDLMVMKDPKTKEQAAKITQLLYNTGKGGGAWDENTQNQLRNNLGDLINERTVGSMLREKFGTQKQSFFEALTTVNTKESAQMFNLLNNQFQFTDKSLDVDGDGDIDATDFKKDATKFINVLTDKTHPNYDPSATKQAYIDFLVEGEAKTQWQMGNNVYKKNQNKGGDGEGYYINNQYLTGPAKAKVDQNVAILNKDEDFGAQSGWNGIKFKRENGQYMLHDGTEYKETTRENILTNLGLTESEGIKPFEVKEGDESNETGAFTALKMADINLDDGDLKDKIKENYPGFEVKKNIDGINDAGVEVLEVIAKNGQKIVVYMQGDTNAEGEATNPAVELEKLNNFLKQNQQEVELP